VKAGADVVQIYTGLIYRGPDLITEVAQALRAGRSTRTAEAPTA
jgi:dihydroorotate dehydrogenase